MVGLDTFVNLYYEYQTLSDEYECENFRQSNCDCEDNGNQGEDFDADVCEYDCFVEAGMDSRCVDRNPYDDEEQEENGFEVERYMECAKWENGQEDSEFFIGPYCSEQGGAIYLGVFLDEKCTSFADKKKGRETFKSLTGTNLPYSSDSIVRTDSCMSCQRNADWEDEDDNYYDGQNGQVSNLCKETYYSSGKCEVQLPKGTVYKQNNDACAYIDVIQTVSQNGISKSKSDNVGTTVFISFLIIMTLCLGFYVQFLRRRIAIKNEAIQTVLLEPTEDVRRMQVPVID